MPLREVVSIAESAWRDRRRALQTLRADDLAGAVPKAVDVIDRGGARRTPPRLQILLERHCAPYFPGGTDSGRSSTGNWLGFARWSSEPT